MHKNTNKNTNNYTTMGYFIKLKLMQELDSNSPLRHELAVAMEISERAVYNTVRRYLDQPFPNSVLTKLAAVRFFESKGFKEEEVFTENQPAL